MYYNNKRLALNIFWLVLGAVLVALSVAKVLPEEGLYAGMGGALMAVGALRVAMAVKYRKDPVYREKIDTEADDERNRFLRMKSWAWTGYVVVLLEGLGVIIAMILGRQDVQQLLSFSICLIVGVYWVCYVILCRKY